MRFLLRVLFLSLLSNLDVLSRPVLSYERALEHNGKKETYCREIVKQNTQERLEEPIIIRKNDISWSNEGVSDAAYHAHVACESRKLSTETIPPKLS